MPSSHRRGLVPAGAGHPRVRQFLNIKHNRTVSHGRVFALEGLWAIRAAIAAALPVEVLFVCPELLRGDHVDALLTEVGGRGTLTLQVSERVVRRMVDRDGPDGLAAIVSMPEPRLEHLVVGERARVVVADSFELAGNLGTLIRCADGAGASAVVLTDRRVRVNHTLVVKASMGTLFSTPVVAAGREEALGWLRSHGFAVVAANPDAPGSYRDVEYSPRVAVVLGSERYGLAPFWREAADACVSIPMLGVADSLNVVHAAALLLYEALHQQDSRQ